MSKITVNGVTLFYKEKGSGPETLVFSHGYLVDSTHFAPQIEVLSDRYRCIAYDHRGHGRSQAPKGGYDMENLYADAVALIEALNCASCHFVGLSTITAPTLVIVGEKDMAKAAVRGAANCGEDSRGQTGHHFRGGAPVHDRGAWCGNYGN